MTKVFCVNNFAFSQISRDTQLDRLQFCSLNEITRDRVRKHDGPSVTDREKGLNLKIKEK